MKTALQSRRERLTDRLDHELRERDLVVFDGRVTDLKTAKRRWWWLQARSLIACAELILVTLILLLLAYFIYELVLMNMLGPNEPGS